MNDFFIQNAWLLFVLQTSHNACLLKTEDAILKELLRLIAYRDLFPM